MTRVPGAAVSLIALAAVGLAHAQAHAHAPAVQWTHEGYKSLVEAAATAKKNERRLLVGLSGGDT